MITRKFLSLAIGALGSPHCYGRNKLLKSHLINSNSKAIYFSHWSKRQQFKMGCPTSKHSKFTIADSTTNSQPTSPPRRHSKNRNSTPNQNNQNFSTMTEQEDSYIEEVVCKNSDIQDNEMKAFEMGDGAGKVLLVRHKGQLSALGYKCTHYGAPLEKSALGDGRLRCQWHGACFNIATGDIEDFPGLDSLPCYQVTITGDDEVKVRARRSELETNKRVKLMSKRDSADKQSIVVVGGGPSGATCVEVLRQEGFKGQIHFVCREKVLPYDRVKVSKTMDFDVQKAQFRTNSFYSSNDIEVYTGTEATAVNTQMNSVTLSNGLVLNYDHLYIATGCRANKLNIPGADLKNVVVLRDYEHSEYLNPLLTSDKDVVICGSSFIAMEAASYCVNKVNKVTIIGRSAVPFKALLGSEIGEAFMNLFKEKGVQFKMRVNVKCCIGDGSCNISSVELDDGTTLKADIVIMGVGSSFNTEFLNGSGVNLRPEGTVEVNEYLQSNIPNVYVGGDIAYAPVWSYGNHKSAIGHYGLAHYHGKMAALNMLDRRTSLKAVPYFWTMLFGKSIRYAGHGKYDDIIYTGNVAECKFVAFYLANDEVIATSSCGMDPIVSQFAEYLAQGKKLYRKDLKDDPLAWTKLVAAVA